MIGESNPRDSYYSSLIDEYMTTSPRDVNPPTPAWNHIVNGVKRRPSLNLHPRNNSISSLKRVPSFDCPSQTPKSPTQISLMFNYTSSPGCFASPPPSPGNILSEYNSFSNSHNNKELKNFIEKTDNLTVPQRNRRGSMESLSSGSCTQEDFHTRPSSANSYYEDIKSTPIVYPTKHSSLRKEPNNSYKRRSDADR